MSDEKKIIHPVEIIPGARSGFIDNSQNTMPQEPKKKLIRPMTFEEKLKSPEEKIYIIFYNFNNVDEDDPAARSFTVAIGRTSAYEDIRDKLISGLDIDVHRSYVMTETRQTETETGDIKYYMIPYNKCLSVYAFCVSVSDFYSDDGFDIEDYAEGDIPDEDERLYGAKCILSAEQINYRNMLEESISRGVFIDNMRKIYGSDSSEDHNI